jgi:hypothetical protein
MIRVGCCRRGLSCCEFVWHDWARLILAGAAVMLGQVDFGRGSCDVGLFVGYF